MSSEDCFVVVDIYYFTFGGFKYNIASFVTELTNTQKIVFESFIKQYIFDRGGRIITNATYFDYLSFFIVSEGNKSSIL